MITLAALRPGLTRPEEPTILHHTEYQLITKWFTKFLQIYKFTDLQRFYKVLQRFTKVDNKMSWGIKINCFLCTPILISYGKLLSFTDPRLHRRCSNYPTWCNFTLSRISGFFSNDSPDFIAWCCCTKTCTEKHCVFATQIVSQKHREQIRLLIRAQSQASWTKHTLLTQNPHRLCIPMQCINTLNSWKAPWNSAGSRQKSQLWFNHGYKKGTFISMDLNH